MQTTLTLVCECSARGKAQGTAQGRDKPCFIKRDRPRFFESNFHRKRGIFIGSVR